jgi:hypothetical protein
LDWQEDIIPLIVIAAAKSFPISFRRSIDLDLYFRRWFFSHWDFPIRFAEMS